METLVVPGVKNVGRTRRNDWTDCDDMWRWWWFARAPSTQVLFVSIKPTADKTTNDVVFIINCFLFENATNHIGNGNRSRIELVAVAADGDRWAPPSHRLDTCSSLPGISVYLNSYSFITLMAIGGTIPTTISSSMVRNETKRMIIARVWWGRRPNRRCCCQLVALDRHGGRWLAPQPGDVGLYCCWCCWSPLINDTGAGWKWN